jgi:hypothetical protein
MKKNYEKKYPNYIMPKKKSVNVKPITDHNKVQLDIKKSLDDDKKIRPEKVFDGFSKSTSKKKSRY